MSVWDCFEHKSGRWVPIASLSECRQYAPSLDLSLQNEELLIITGGTDMPIRYLGIIPKKL